MLGASSHVTAVAEEPPLVAYCRRMPWISSFFSLFPIATQLLCLWYPQATSFFQRFLLHGN